MTHLLNNSFEEESRSFENEINNFLDGNNIRVFTIINDNLLNNNEEGSTGDSINVIEWERIENEPGFLRRRRERGRGRGRGDTNGEHHNKFAFDNMLRKTKSIIIKILFDFINKKIMIVYNGNIGHGNNIKKLFLLNHSQISNANIDFNRSFLEKTLKEIFSADLSNRINNYKKDHNKILIEKLINEEEKKKKGYFHGLFNLTFIDCLKYFREANLNKANNVYIEGLKRFCDLENDASFRSKNDPEFIEYLKKFINNYEYGLSRRRSRNSRRNNNMEN